MKKPTATISRTRTALKLQLVDLDRYTIEILIQILKKEEGKLWQHMSEDIQHSLDEYMREYYLNRTT